MHRKRSMVYGYVLIAVSLICKGLFIDNQSFTKNTYKPTQYQLLYTVNFASFIISCLALLFKQQLHLALAFSFNHQEIIFDIIKFSCLSVIGQILIYYVGCNFGLRQNMLPLISTTRKILTMLMNLHLSNKKVNAGMGVGLVLVFGGLVY